MKYTPNKSNHKARSISSFVVALIVLLLLAGAGRSAFYPAVKYESGDLGAEIDSFVERMPESDSEAYDKPTSSQRETMAEAFEAIEAGELSQAASLVNPLEYDVVQYEDTATGRTYTMLSERRRADGSWAHAWGLYIFSPESTSNSIIEVVHPLSDLRSEKVGLETFRKADARYLFVSGAHRRANTEEMADVAHAGTSIFERLHRVALESATVVFQPHGFSKEEHPEYGEMVISSGTDNPSPLAENLHHALREMGFDARLYEGEAYSELGATTNVQGVSTRTTGVDFLHLEVTRAIREDERSRELLTNMVARYLR